MATAPKEPVIPLEDRRTEAAEFFQSLQDEICKALEKLDGRGRFREDTWERAGGGGGRSRVLAGGAVFEKGGVNFSEVFGTLNAELARQLPGGGEAFSATGISVVVHPQNPMVPAVHANFRYLTRGLADWVGGGSDLTPYYPYREDVVHFHRAWKDLCGRHPGVADYRRFKRWCDEYFYLPHRDEARGVGGIFFDYIEGEWPARFDFVRACGRTFLEAYLPIASRRKDEPYGPGERLFQEHRRGRYVEFNLLYDRGTVFGLRTGGRAESILMSLPPVARWEYDYRPGPGTAEARLAEFLQPQDWAEEEQGEAAPEPPA